MPKKKKWSIQKQETMYGYIFISPWLIGLVCFIAGPMIFSLIASFTNYNMLKMEFIGFDNFIMMFKQDPVFWKSFSNTLIYALMNVPLVTAGGVIVAVMLNKAIWGMRGFRTIFYLPNIMVGIGTYFLWMMLLNPTTGLVNQVLAIFGITGPAWLADPNWTKPAIVLMHVWGLGGQMLLYLARLQSIPKELYEACEIDGASKFSQFRNVTIPMLTPIIFYNLVIGIIGAFQIFQEGYVMSSEGSGAPANSLLFYNLHLWKQAFEKYRTGYASAMAWFMFIFILGLTLVNQKISKRWVYYEGGE